MLFMLDRVSVLVVEDDKLNQKIMSFMLRKNGADIKMALNGNEAIKLLSADKFDVILMDLQMPFMDGFTTAHHIRKNMHIDIPIIALTADSFANQTNEYIEAGMNACVCKPVESAILCKLILSLINKVEINNN